MNSEHGKSFILFAYINIYHHKYVHNVDLVSTYMEIGKIQQQFIQFIAVGH